MRLAYADQGDDVSSHADTIRAAFPAEHESEPGVYEIPSDDQLQAAEDALDALLAENQRRGDALTAIVALDKHTERLEFAQGLAREALAGDEE